MTSGTKLNSLCLLGRWDAEDPAGNFMGWRDRRGNHLEGLFDIQDILSKVSTLGDGTARDTCGWSESRQLSSIDVVKSIAKNGLYKSSTPSGTCTLFKTLYTNACGFDCAYCVNSARNTETYSYTPEEVASIFHALSTKKLAQGLFLSSAMGRDPETTMDAMIQSVEILRTKYAFQGYVHLKILPGASRYQVERAAQLADRVSVNVEEPSSSRLGEVCAVKDYRVDILRRQAWVKELDYNLPSGQATQFIIGATDETDWEIMSRMHYLYQEMQMRRIYYSAFEPVAETKLQSRNATPSWRERRLYQVDWLYRVYHYHMEEISEALVDDFLPNADPKITLAHLYLDRPVEVNEASMKELLRIPGIGPRSAKRIIELRRNGTRIRSGRQLADMGVVVRRAQAFLKVDGNCQSTLKGWF
ncbi:MAG: helix-hairpin-helix domain-containing protein [Candidatus Bathyarchaeia archaeon]